jgi:hypothetical protein
MAVTAHWYGNVFDKAMNKEIDFEADDIHICLLDNTYVPDQAHEYFDDVVGDELPTAGGYTHEGEPLTVLGAAYNAGTGIFNIDATVDPVWAAATFTAAFAVIFDNTPAADADKPLISYIDFGGDVSVTAGTFTITLAGGGIAKVTVA